MSKDQESKSWSMSVDNNVGEDDEDECPSYPGMMTKYSVAGIMIVSNDL